MVLDNSSSDGLEQTELELQSPEAAATLVDPVVASANADVSAAVQDVLASPEELRRAAVAQRQGELMATGQQKRLQTLQAVHEMLRSGLIPITGLYLHDELVIEAADLPIIGTMVVVKMKGSEEETCIDVRTIEGSMTINPEDLAD